MENDNDDDDEDVIVDQGISDNIDVSLVVRLIISSLFRS
jgi:hypothetical protein